MPAENETARRFTLKRAEISIELEQEDGTIGPYTLREMTGAARDVYFKQVTSKGQFDAQGQVMKVTDPTGLQTALICLCMVDAAGKSASPQFVNNLRTSVQNEIFEMCSTLNGLDKLAVDRAKNS